MISVKKKKTKIMKRAIHLNFFRVKLYIYLLPMWTTHVHISLRTVVIWLLVSI